MLFVSFLKHMSMKQLSQWKDCTKECIKTSLGPLIGPSASLLCLCQVLNFPELCSESCD